MKVKDLYAFVDMLKEAKYPANGDVMFQEHSVIEGKLQSSLKNVSKANLATLENPAVIFVSETSSLIARLAKKKQK